MQTKEQWNDGAAYLIFVRNMDNILGSVEHISVSENAGLYVLFNNLVYF